MTFWSLPVKVPHPVVLFFNIFSCFLVFSRVFLYPFPAPCSAFSHRSAKRDTFRTSDRKALQGARIRLRKTPFSRVFSCFQLFLELRSGLPTHHFGQKVSKGVALAPFDSF